MTVTYEQVAEQRDRLQPWVRFLGDIGGDEWSEHIEAMYNAGSSAVSMNEEAAKTIFDLIEDEIKEAREDWLPQAVQEYRRHESAVAAVYERLCETGELQWPQKPTNADVSAHLKLCGDGSVEAPWATDALVKVAKMLRAKGF